VVERQVGVATGFFLLTFLRTAFCGKCGSRVGLDQRFCSTCGSPQATVPYVAQQVPSYQQVQHYPQQVAHANVNGPPIVIMSGDQGCRHDFQQKVKPSALVWCIVCFFNPFCWFCLCRKRAVCVKCGYSSSGAVGFG
jgi:hypothetical protein